MKTVYADHRVTYSPPNDEFRFTASTATVDDISGGHVRGAMHYGSQSEPEQKVIMCVMAGGRFDYRGRTDECSCEAGDAFVFPYGERFEASVQDPDIVTLQVPIERVMQTAQANFGPLRNRSGSIR